MKRTNIQREPYPTYLERIQKLICHLACFPPENEALITSSGLRQKFNEDGSFRAFYGDTVVFQLSEERKQFLQNIQEALYQASGEMLSKRLPADSLHITLHDLSAAPLFSDIQTTVKAHQTPILKKLPELKSKGSVSVLAKGMVSMVSSSIVMLFVPVSETDHNTIQEMYGVLEEICPLPYPLTLHCTLAYYKPGIYLPEEWNPLYQYLKQWNHLYQDNMIFKLESDEIEYQFFHSMYQYRNAFLDGNDT